MSTETHPAEAGPPRAWPKLSQETIAVVTVGVALAALMLTSVSDLREEGRVDRIAWQAESQSLREEARQEREALRESARQDRAAVLEAIRLDRERFDREILRLTGETAWLSAQLGPPAPTPGDSQTPGTTR